jgi:hypothetical protein
MIGKQVEKIVNSREDPKKVRAMLRKLLKQVENTYEEVKRDFAEYMEIVDFPEEVIQEKLMRLNSIYNGYLIEEERVSAGGSGLVPSGEETKKQILDSVAFYTEPKMKALKEATKKQTKALAGKGLIATHSAEDAGGLTHIYPLSHAHILEMCKHLI